MRTETFFVGFLGASLLVHAAIGGVACVAPYLHHASKLEVPSVALNGDTFNAPTLEPITEHDETASEGAQTNAVTFDAPPPGALGKSEKVDDGYDKKLAKNTRRGGAPKIARPAASARENAPDHAGAQTNAVYGAVGDRTAVDLAAAFTRAFPQASSPDPQWANAPLGSAGETTVTLTLDESGHIESVATNAPPGPLASGVARTMAMLRARAFTAHGKTTRINVSARITPDQVHDGLHGDKFAIGMDGNAFFALPNGRRIDLRITLR